MFYIQGKVCVSDDLIPEKILKHIISRDILVSCKHFDSGMNLVHLLCS